MSRYKSPSLQPTPVRDTSHLADFAVSPRLLVITAIALPVGALSACTAWVLLRLIGLITNAVFYQRWDAELVAPGVRHHNPFLVLGAPIAGGLVIGVMARYGSEKIRGHGMPEAIEAVLHGRSTVQPRVAILKPVSAAISIGSGGPFGAEGPIIMTGGAVGSICAQFLHVTADERKTLLVAGSTAGMAAVFNTPLAALMLAVELLLFEWRARSYVPVAASIAVSTALRHPLLGDTALFPNHSTLHLSGVIYLLCAASGVASGVLALLLTQLVYKSEDAFQRLPIHWMWWPAIGGLIIGLGALIEPQALGVGYNVIGEELTGSITIGLVIGILIVKTLIWGLSLGSGTSGGVLAPIFMIGGALGALESHVLPSVGPGFWALIGLAGILGGVLRSPLTAVVFSLELTQQLHAILPLIIAASAAYCVSTLVLRRSILTEKLARRGRHLSREYHVDPLELIFVEDVLHRDVLCLQAGLDAATALKQISGLDPETVAARRQLLYPVLDGSRFVTVVTRGDLESAAHFGRDDEAVEALSTRTPVTCHPDETLRLVAYRMAEHDVDRMPVLDRHDPERVVGLVTLADLLHGRREALFQAQQRERIFRLGRRPRATAMPAADCPS